MRAAVQGSMVCNFRAGEKKAERQVELSRSRCVKAKSLLELHEVAFLKRNLSGTAGYLTRLKDYHNLWGEFCFCPETGRYKL